MTLKSFFPSFDINMRRLVKTLSFACATNVLLFHFVAKIYWFISNFALCEIPNDCV